jgi:hypothetical protein
VKNENFCKFIKIFSDYANRLRSVVVILWRILKDTNLVNQIKRKIMGMYVVWRPEVFSKNHESFRSIEDLRDKIKENRSEIENLKAQIRGLAMATPRDITPADYTPVEYINGYMDELFEKLEDLIGYTRLLETLDDEETFEYRIDEAIDYYNLRKFVGEKDDEF